MCGGPRGLACNQANNGRDASRKSRGGAALSPDNFSNDCKGGGMPECPVCPHMGQCSAFKSCEAGSEFDPASLKGLVDCRPGSTEIRSTPRVVQTSVIIAGPEGPENRTIAWEMVGMIAIAIMAQSAAQTPKRSTTRDNPWGGLIDCPDGWIVRGARWAIGERYRRGLKRSRNRSD